jgi:hypothetical protein
MTMYACVLKHVHEFGMIIKLIHTRLAREGLFGVRLRRVIMSVWIRAPALRLGTPMHMPRETQFHRCRKGLTEALSPA